MIVADPVERGRLRAYAILLTLGFWAFHLLFTLLRGIWLPVPTEALSARVAFLTSTGLVLCAVQYPLLERLPTLRWPAMAGLLVACAACAGLLNASAPVLVHWLEFGLWPRDAEPVRFMSAAAHWTWVFLAWSAMIVALVYRVQGSAVFAGAAAAEPDRAGDLWLPHRGQLARVALQDVVRFEAAGDYAVVHTADRHYLTHESLRSFEQRLDPNQFARVHRGAIVRLDEVARIERGPNGLVQLRLRNGDLVPVSRSHRRRLAERLGAD